LFLALVLAGFAYLWKKGALDWSKSDAGEIAGDSAGDHE
jgi:hypothetical protein